MVFVQVLFCCPFLYCGTALVDFVTMLAWIFSLGLCGSRCHCGGIQKRWCRTNFESNVTNDEESGYARVRLSLNFPSHFPPHSSNNVTLFLRPMGSGMKRHAVRYRSSTFDMFYSFPIYLFKSKTDENPSCLCTHLF